MKQAIIENGTVVNVVIGNAGGIEIPEDSTVSIGWGYASGGGGGAGDGNFSFALMPIDKNALMAKIEAMEKASLMPRPVREFLLIASIERAVAAGYTEPQLYAANLAYKKVKDFDAQITELRTQMESL
jgi:hypothetical protein